MKDFLRIANRQGAPQRRVEERKYRSVGSDAERKRQNSDRCEARRLAQHAETKAQIPNEVVNPIYTAGVAAFLFGLLDTAQVQPCAPPRFLACHPFCDVSLGCSFEVVTQFVIQFPVLLRPAKQRPYP